MYLLDTDHLSVLERGGAESERLRRRLQAVPPDEVAATVVSYEEQTRGWLSYLTRARSLEEQVASYGYLQRHLRVFCAVPLIAFDPAAAAIVRQLQQQRIRIGTNLNREHRAGSRCNPVVAQRDGLPEGAGASHRRLD